MAELFASGRVIDAILALVVIEMIAIGIWHARSGRGIAAVDLFAGLAPGVALLLALRSSLMTEPWTHPAGWLALAFAAHLVDVSRRWKA